MHKELICDIVEKGSKSQMIELKDIIVKLLDDIKKDDCKSYKDFEMSLYKILYGDKLCENYAKDWVAKLVRNDGGFGEKWTVDETESIKSLYVPTADKWEWYAVVNSIYSDFYHDKFDDTVYFQLAKDFITDKDAVKGKVLNYYMYIVA